MSINVQQFWKKKYIFQDAHESVVHRPVQLPFQTLAHKSPSHINLFCTVSSIYVKEEGEKVGEPGKTSQHPDMEPVGSLIFSLLGIA